MEKYSIRKTLRKCKRAASKGYKLSVKQYKVLNDKMNDSSKKIEITLKDINNSSCYISDATEDLSEQLVQTRKMLSELSKSINEDLVTLKENLSKFSITLFGKTMAGKSTLMEILTESDGQSIGKGSQRTTRDVRSYTWNNLEITDVPGIGAFEGEEDEDIAFHAARKADLILFLITDDAPQAAEAECLSRVIKLGKPVVCVLNVKSSMRDGENPKITLRNMQKAFNEERLDTLKRQFMAFASLDDEVWDDIPIISVHFKAAFMSQKTDDSQMAKELLNASHIDLLKEKIIEEVETHGKYYREKTFVDIVSVPSLEFYENLLFQSNMNEGLSRTVIEKKHQLSKWSEKYHRDALSQIDSLILSIEAKLKMEISSFIEDHYEDKNTNKAWEQVIISNRVYERCNDLSKKLVEEVDDRLRELSRSITNELQYASSIIGERNMIIPKMKKIVNTKRTWNWGMLALGGALTIAHPLMVIPLALIKFGGDSIFDSKEKKEERARKKLEKSIQKDINRCCKELRSQLNSALEKVMQSRLNLQIEELERIVSLIKRLSKEQKELAIDLQPNILEQSKQILDAAFRLVYGGRYANRVFAAARVPGKLLVAQLDEGIHSLPERKINKLKKLMQEELCFIEKADEEKQLLNALLGDVVDSCTYENGIYHLPMENFGQDKVRRIRIAQQFLGTYFEVIKEKKHA